MITFATTVVHAPPTLLPAHWSIEHRRRTCRQVVPGHQLIEHARHHETEPPENVSQDRFCGPETTGVVLGCGPMSC